jgi:hypothetical protein
MGLDARQLRAWPVLVDGSEAAAAAALELRAALLVGELPSRPGEGESGAQGDGGKIVLQLDAAVPTPGFDAEVADGAIRIAGATRRDLVDGVAWLRERLGIVANRPAGEAIEPSPGELEAGGWRQRPAFAERGFVLGCDGLHEEWRAWFAFASRNRMNAIFLHDTPPSRADRPAGAPRPRSREESAADRGGWMFELWDEEGQAVLAEARRLGLRLEFGGHHLSTLLPRANFEEHPEWFPLRGGERRREHNLCVSNAAAAAALRDGARRFFERFAGVEVYHVWADDLRAGGWCECPGCRELTPSDQALVATNLVAEVAPGARVAHLAYHDTLEAPRLVRPRENVDALWAPRGRCYAHAIDDGGCRRNAEHLAGLEWLIEWFGEPRRVRVFEYYSDGILFKWMAPPHVEVLPRDMAAYGRLGVGAVLNLAVTPRPWVGPNWHAWWFARCAWEGGGDPAEGLRRFCSASFGEAAANFAGAFGKLDEACRLLLDRGVFEERPGFDLLDYGDTPRQELRALAGRASAALAGFAAAVREVPIAVDGAGREQVEEFAATVAAGMHLAERVLAWDCALDGKGEEAMEHLRMADVHLRALADWYDAHAGPAFGNVGEWMLRGARRHTARVRELASS